MKKARILEQNRNAMKDLVSFCKDKGYSLKTCRNFSSFEQKELNFFVNLDENNRYEIRFTTTQSGLSDDDVRSVLTVAGSVSESVFTAQALSDIMTNEKYVCNDEDESTADDDRSLLHMLDNTPGYEREYTVYKHDTWLTLSGKANNYAVKRLLDLCESEGRSVSESLIAEITLGTLEITVSLSDDASYSVDCEKKDGKPDTDEIAIVVEIANAVISKNQFSAKEIVNLVMKRQLGDSDWDSEDEDIKESRTRSFGFLFEKHDCTYTLYTNGSSELMFMGKVRK